MGGVHVLLKNPACTETDVAVRSLQVVCRL